jgi:hypothetical protein
MESRPSNEKTGYVRWMKRQGLPIQLGHGMADLRSLEVAPCARAGGKAAFIQLHGMQGHHRRLYRRNSTRRCA